MLAQPPAIMNFRDDINRADNADMGADWRPEFDSCKVVTNRAQCSTPASSTGRQGGWETYVPSSDYNGGRLLTDNWAVEAQLIAPVGNQAVDNWTAIGACMLDNGPASGMVLVYFTVSVTSNSAIYSYSNASIAAPGQTTLQTGQTLRSGAAGNTPASSLIRIERRMYSATQSVVTAYRAGSSVGSWNDSGGVLPSGDRAKRRWFVVGESNYPTFVAPFYSPAIDWARAYDLKL